MELTPDIQTGRNVYADKDLYESDDMYKAKIDSYVNEGFKLVYGSPDDPSEGGGGSGGGSVLIITSDGSKLDKTYGEIREALLNGTNVLLDESGHYYFVKDFQLDNDGGGAIYFNNGTMYMTSSDDGYPEIYD